jgi:type II secretory pathway pseudopilin PulG
MKIFPYFKKSPANKKFRAHAEGMTLLELTVVILVLLSLISILFIGANAWKKGSDQALCILNIRNVQNGVRSFSNLYGHSPGQSVAGLQMRIVGLGKFVETTPACPASGTYTYGSTFGTDTIPPTGELYLQCSLSTTGHEPANFSDW